MTSWSLLGMSLSIQPSLLLAFCAPTAHWSLILNLLSTRFPRSLSIKLHPRQAYSSLRCSPLLCFFGCNTLHLSLLNSIEFLLAHSSRQSRSSCRVASFLTQFGTKEKLCKGTCDPIFQITYKDVKQPNIDPLGTPLVTGCHFEKEPFATTQWVLPFSPFPTRGTDHCLDHYTLC